MTETAVPSRSTSPPLSRAATHPSPRSVRPTPCNRQRSLLSPTWLLRAPSPPPHSLPSCSILDPRSLAPFKIRRYICPRSSLCPTCCSVSLDTHPLACSSLSLLLCAAGSRLCRSTRDSGCVSVAPCAIPSSPRLLLYTRDSVSLPLAVPLVCGPSRSLCASVHA